MSGPNGAQAPDQQPAMMLPLHIAPDASPSVWSVGEATLADGTRKVFVQIHHAKGVTLDLLDPTAAMEIAGRIGSTARGITSGLILPPGVGR